MMLDILAALPGPLQQTCVAAMGEVGAKLLGAAWGTLKDQQPEQVLAGF